MMNNSVVGETIEHLQKNLVGAIFEEIRRPPLIVRKESWKDADNR